MLVFIDEFISYCRTIWTTCIKLKGKQGYNPRCEITIGLLLSTLIHNRSPHVAWGTFNTVLSLTWEWRVQSTGICRLIWLAEPKRAPNTPEYIYTFLLKLYGYIHNLEHLLIVRTLSSIFPLSIVFLQTVTSRMERFMLPWPYMHI